MTKLSSHFFCQSAFQLFNVCLLNVKERKKNLHDCIIFRFEKNLFIENVSLFSFS